ncbi:MAG: DUF2321 domain-containing protein [Anaerovoracaceae bacterium]
MSNYYAHVCENGHAVVDHRRGSVEKICKECGGTVLDNCPTCGEPIKKWYYYGSAGMKPKSFQRPDVCKHCGGVFPWAK